MTKKIDELLSESADLSDEMKSKITGLWESKLTETREVIASELREEFARKYEHDKGIITESMDRFLTERITEELSDLTNDVLLLREQKKQLKERAEKHTATLDKFILEGMKKELTQFATDKKVMKESFRKLESFLMKKLAEEIRDFREDKKALVTQKVKMVTEGKKQIREAKLAFMKRATKLLESHIDKTLTNELRAFKKEIKVARENDFGRKIFEAFGAEFMSSYLSEGTQVKQMQKVLESKDMELAKMKVGLKQKDKLAESLNSKLKVTQDLVERQKVLNELLSPLSRDKKNVMRELLESVQTKNLNTAYKKYLPSVLNENVNSRRSTVLSESVLSEKTGNRVSTQNGENDASELDKILALAGVRK